MDKDITRTVDALCEADDADVSVLRAEVESRVATGEFDWAGGLAAELAARTAAGRDRQGHCAAALYWTLNALAARPGPQSLRALVRVLDSPHPGVSPRYLAAVVAHGHRIEDIADEVFDRAPETADAREFAACLLHETVLVTDAVNGYPALRAFADTLLAEGHPLAVLPLALLPEEHGLRRPVGAADDWTWTVPAVWPEPGDALETTPATRQRVAGAEPTETSLPATTEAMGAAVAHWLAQSNGKLAAQEFWLPDPVAPEDLPALLALLPLTPWPPGQTPARLHPSDPDLALRTLLTAALRAPAYGHGNYGAYGRLAAWRSLAALTGTPVDAPITRTADRVRQTTWLRLGTASAPWFHNVAWDLALAALHPDGRHLAVLAATDTD